MVKIQNYEFGIMNGSPVVRRPLSVARCRLLQRNTEYRPGTPFLRFLLLFLLSQFIVHNSAFPQQPQAQSGQPLYPVNAKYVQGFGPGYWPTAGSNLTLNLAPGTAVCNNVVQTYAGGTLTLAPSATNYVYLNSSNNCAPASNSTGFTAATIPIATVITNSTAISSITDVRTLFVSSSGSGGGNLSASGSPSQYQIGVFASSSTLAGVGPGTATYPLVSNGSSANPSYQVLPLAGGGTGQTSALAAFNALSPLTTEGDLHYYHSSSNARLGIGSNGQCLTSNGTDPVWGSCAGGGSSLFTSYQFGMNTAMTGNSLYFQLGIGTGLTSSYSGSGTSGSPYVGTISLAAPTASTLGGIESITSASHNWLSYIDTSGVPHQSRPADTDISGTTAGATLYVNSGALAELSTTPYSVKVSGATNPAWATPSANAQCFMSGASNYATTTPSFQTCPSGGGSPAGVATELQYRNGSSFGAVLGSVSSTGGAVSVNPTGLTCAAPASVVPTNGASTTYYYTQAAVVGNLQQDPHYCTQTSTTTGPTTLSSSAYNTITTTAVTGASGCIVYRGSNGSGPYIPLNPTAPITCGSSIQDTGSATRTLWPSADFTTNFGVQTGLQIGPLETSLNDGATTGYYFDNRGVLIDLNDNPGTYNQGSEGLTIEVEDQSTAGHPGNAVGEEVVALGYGTFPTGDLTGINVQTIADTQTGTAIAASAVGVSAYVQVYGTGTLANATGVSGEVTRNSTGTITGSAMALEALSNTAPALNNYGLYVASQTAGTNNWAIKTNSGLNEFGSYVLIDPVTVATLPAAAAANKGYQMTVSDSTAIAAEGQTCVGSGSYTAIALSNGSSWSCFGALAAGGISGALVETTSYTGNSTPDSGKLIVINCSSACTYTFNGSPTAAYYGAVMSIGSATPTVSLNSKNWNGQGTAPTLYKYQVLPFASDGSNYFGNNEFTANSGLSATASAGYTVFQAAASVVQTSQANTYTSGDKQTFGATTAGAASINIPTGTAPTTPAQGDVWQTDRIYVKDAETNTGVVSSVPRRLPITSAVTATSTTAVTLGTFAVAVSQTYCLMCELFIQSASTSNTPTMLVTCPASATASQFGFVYRGSTTAATQADAACGTTMAPAATTTASNTFLSELRGLLQNGTTTGSLTVQVESSGSYNTIIEPGSFCVLY